MMNQLSPAGCGELNLYLEGGNTFGGILSSVFSDTTSLFDGYVASYEFTPFGGVYPNELTGTCFGFEEDTKGYYCVGAYGAEDFGYYSFHGAGYWMLTQE